MSTAVCDSSHLRQPQNNELCNLRLIKFLVTNHSTMQSPLFRHGSAFQKAVNGHAAPLCKSRGWNYSKQISLTTSSQIHYWERMQKPQGSSLWCTSHRSFDTNSTATSSYYGVHVFKPRGLVAITVHGSTSLNLKTALFRACLTSSLKKREKKMKFHTCGARKEWLCNRLNGTALKAVQQTKNVCYPG